MKDIHTSIFIITKRFHFFQEKTRQVAGFVVCGRGHFRAGSK